MGKDIEIRIKIIWFLMKDEKGSPVENRRSPRYCKHG